MRTSELSPEELHRWDEIQFYSICNCILKIRNNMMDVLRFIENLNFAGNYDIKKVQELANQILSNRYFIPNKDELCMIYYLHGYSVNWINQKTGYTKSEIYSVLKKYETQPIYIFSRFNVSDVEIFKPFLDAFNKIRKAGLD